MSAGGLSYSVLTNHGKATLPSVDSWGTNNNILRDPPKSITTRRIDKVGETSSLTQMLDESGNRSCEAIQVYARGVNPSVSVSYSNYGNNGGGMTGSMTGLGANNNRQAKLPYTIMKDGAFRAPIERLTQEFLMPLSRQNRTSTTAFTQPGFADFSRKLRTCGTSENTKEVYTNKLTTSVRPTAVYKVEKPLDRPSETKNAIQNTINNSVSSGTRTMDITERTVIKPTKEIYNNPLHANALSNVNDNRHAIIDNNNMETSRYIQEIESSNVVSNTSTNLGNYTTIDEVLDLSDLPIKDINNISHTAPYSVSGDGTTYIHDAIELERKLPAHTSNTNKNTSIVHKKIDHDNNILLDRNTPLTNFENINRPSGERDHGSRSAKLLDKISPGEYNNQGQKPSFNRIQNGITLRDNNKILMDRNVMSSVNNKFLS